MKPLRIFALLLAVVSLGMMLRSSQRQVIMATDFITLQTPGFSGSSDHSGGLILALPGAASGAPQIPDVGYLARHFTGLKTLRILGDGLRAEELARLPESVRVSFPDLDKEEGLQFISWPDAVPVGAPVIVEGTITLPSEGGSRAVELCNPAGTIVSISVSGAGRTPFRLSDLPPTAGRFTYRLSVANSGGAMMVAGEFGVEVLPVHPLRVLILANEPRAESRELRNWLAEKGFPVAVRTRLGKEIYQREELNGASIGAGLLDAENLRFFDVLIADGATLAELQPREREVLVGAVRSDGLGLLMLADGDLPRIKFQHDLSPFDWTPAAAGVGLEENRVTWSERETPLESPLPTFPNRLKISPADRALIVDPQGSALVAGRRMGAGFVALSVILESERWRLQGHPEMFAEYWSHLLGALAPADRHGSAWARLENGPILPDWVVGFQLRTTVERPQASWQDAGGSDHPLALKQELFDSRTWKAECWPGSAGWHSVALRDGAKRNFFVSPADQWVDLEKATRQRETSLRAARTGESSSGEIKIRWQDILWPLTFLCSLAFLWITERLRIDVGRRRI